jgi:uncharacterized protein
MSSFRIDVADLLSTARARRTVHLAEPVEDLVGSAAAIVDLAVLDLDLERISEGIVVRGRVSATWRGDCSRCLGPLTRPFDVHVDELFEPDPVPGETYPIEGHELDLDQLVRDALLLELPLAPQCDPPCSPALIGGDETEDSSAPDPRWAVLSELEI